MFNFEIKVSQLLNAFLVYGLNPHEKNCELLQLVSSEIKQLFRKKPNIFIRYFSLFTKFTNIINLI